jgi:predicted nucleic acid-binding protein
MSRSSTLCLDASVLVRLVGTPPDAVVMRRWSQWVVSRQPFVAPDFVYYEVTNALYRLCVARRLSELEARLALQRVLDLPIELHRPAHLHLRALELAAQYSLPATYDAHYVALAEHLGVELWTMDRKLHAAVAERLPWVRLVG